MVAVTVMASVTSVVAVHVVATVSRTVVVIAAVLATSVPHLNLAN